MRPDSRTSNESQLPPLEQAIAVRSDGRPSRADERNEDIRYHRLLVDARG